MTILEEFRRLHPNSQDLYRQALESFPSGVTHDLRYVAPFPLYVDRAKGSRKWDVDGNELIDLVMGHGALFLGHAPPTVTQAVAEQLERGTHYGASHRLELEWATWVKRLIPCAREVRFTSSGTEATMMAVRLARAYTGRDRILKFDEHFHGWNDSLSGSRLAEAESPQAAGIPQATLSNTLSIPPNDISQVRDRLTDGDVAAVILEPTGASWGTLPLKPGFLAELREAADSTNTLLLFDEVITGFRVAPGGAQQRYGVTPDLTALAKILAGGLPGGCVAGRADVLSMVEFRGDADWDAHHRVAHPGTYNANPLSAAAGTAMLCAVAEGDLHDRVDSLASDTVEGLNRVLERRRVVGAAYGLASYFHILLGVDCPRPQGGIEMPWAAERVPTRISKELATALKQGMINNGVDLMSPSGGFLSAAHSSEDTVAVIEAFDVTIGQMQANGLL